MKQIKPAPPVNTGGIVNLMLPGACEFCGKARNQCKSASHAKKRQELYAAQRAKS